MMKHKLTAKNTIVPESGHSDDFFQLIKNPKKESILSIFVFNFAKFSSKFFFCDYCEFKILIKINQVQNSPQQNSLDLFK